VQEAARRRQGAQAAIQSAEAGVKRAQVDLERTVIRSPIDGIVVNRAVDVG
jgi:HlyD family secretion protein